MASGGEAQQGKPDTLPRVTSKTLISLMLCFALGALISLSGCGRRMYDPAWATQRYPAELHSTQTADMHVFRRDTSIEIVNSTPVTYEDVDVWINQRYVRRVQRLAAGETITLSLWEFYDEYGDRFNAGGFFRTHEPTPVRLVQIQPRKAVNHSNGERASDGGGGGDAPMVGLITIRREEILLGPTPGR